MIFPVSELDLQSLRQNSFWCVLCGRKLVVGFAFMVPDVAYNEAYISFIFTHAEWRHAGIGSFLLYHLIQVSLLFTHSWHSCFVIETGFTSAGSAYSILRCN